MEKKAIEDGFYEEMDLVYIGRGMYRSGELKSVDSYFLIDGSKFTGIEARQYLKDTVGFTPDETTAFLLELFRRNRKEIRR